MTATTTKMMKLSSEIHPQKTEDKPNKLISAVMAATMTEIMCHTTVKEWSPTPADNLAVNGFIDGRVLQQRVAKYFSLSTLPHSLLVHRI